MKRKLLDWKENDNWGIKELILLLLIEFVCIIAIIKFLISPKLSEWFGNDLYAGTLTGLVMAIILICSIYFITLRPNRLSWGEVGIKSFDKKHWKLIILYTIIVMIIVVIITILTSFIGGTWENNKTNAIQEDISITTFLIAFISASIISPIYEEIFYRGFIFRWFRTRLGVVAATFFSSLIFSIVHIPTFNVIPVAFCSGIVFALIYEKTNSIWPSIIVHGLSNGIMILLTII